MMKILFLIILLLVIFALIFKACVQELDIHIDKYDESLYGSIH